MHFFRLTHNQGIIVAVMLLLCIMLLCIMPLSAQDMTDPAASEEANVTTSKRTIEDVLMIEQDKMRFTYEPEGRRDPFISLLTGKNIEPGVRPDGIEGMNISEITLTGILDWGDKGKIALFLGTDNKTYRRKVGDRVYDGTIVSISKVTVKFEQKVFDITGREKPSKEIEINLHPNNQEGL